MNGETIHERYMRLQLEEAQRSKPAGGNSRGSVVVRRGHILGRGHNLRKPDTVLWPMRKCWRWKKPAVLSVIGGWMDAIYM